MFDGRIEDGNRLRPSFPLLDHLSSLFLMRLQANNALTRLPYTLLCT